MSKEEDSDDYLLDEELAEKINEKESELNSIDNPQTIISGLESIDNQTIEGLYENISKMPREAFIQLLASMGQSKINLGSDYQFKGMSQNSKKLAKDKLEKKIALMKMKQSSRHILQQQHDKHNSNDNSEQNRKLKEHQELLNGLDFSTKTFTNAQNTTDREINQEVNCTKKLSKNQKKKLRAKRKNANLKQTDFANSIDQYNSSQSDHEDGMTLTDSEK